MIASRIGGIAATAALFLCAPATASAQLRPLDPGDWRLWEPGRSFAVEAGGGVLGGQRAALAGTRGTLVEAGNFRALWRTGRVVFEAAGTVQRIFDDDERFAASEANVNEPGPDRHDSGDYRVSSTVRLTTERAPVLAVLRFGTRLPTTDNRVGLDRDAIDFFALAGARAVRGRASLSAETGVSINGTRDPGFEQSDVWVYILRGEVDAGPVVPSLTWTGQMDGLKDRAIRGNEDLSELRLGVRTRGRIYLRGELVKGVATHSPDLGVLLAVGTIR
ncbi:MAG TPA: hypothetical protein VFQ39_10880 [Longimicrobium sp.]|nr:hypothetical protein [Longimicrobium sp.]